ETTATELVEKAIQNIEEWNDTLNAVVHKQYEFARSIANRFDHYFEQLDTGSYGDLPPFFGVPILLKDLGQNQTGQKSTSGARLMEQFEATQTDNFTKSIESRSEERRVGKESYTRLAMYN